MSRMPLARVLPSLCAGGAALAALPAVAGADCVGLRCGGFGSTSYVPEAQSPVPAAVGLDGLRAQRPGFYEIPAPIWQGRVQPSAVVYLSRAGQHRRMPASVGRLSLVKKFVRSGSAVRGATLVVIDRGVLGVVPARAAKSPSEAWSFCGDKRTCLSWDNSWEGFTYVIDGPSKVGTGWHNFTGSGYNNQVNSQVNRRDGDSLLADGWDGTGTRYCAQQQSQDSTLSNNALGNDHTSSWALLGSADSRC